MSKATIKATATDAERAAIVSSLRAKGDRYGSAGIAALAHELAVQMNGDKMVSGAAARLVEATGYDKGTVSRVSKVLRENESISIASFFKADVDVPVADAKAFFGGKTTVRPRDVARALDVMAIESSASSLLGAVIVGKLFKRRPATSTRAPKDEPDFLALLTAWLLESTDEQYAPRKAQVANLLANIDAERAALAAAADAAEDEAEAA